MELPFSVYLSLSFCSIQFALPVSAFSSVEALNETNRSREERQIPRGKRDAERREIDRDSTDAK